MWLHQWAALTCKYNYIQEFVFWMFAKFSFICVLHLSYQHNREIFLKRSQLTFTSSNSTIEALKKGVKYVQS